MSSATLHVRGDPAPRAGMPVQPPASDAPLSIVDAVLVRAGEGNEAERLDVLARHRDRVLAQTAEVSGYLAAIDQKVHLYEQLVAWEEVGRVRPSRSLTDTMMTTTPPTPGAGDLPGHRRRIALAIGAVLITVAGLAVTRLGAGPVADLSGDALYASLIYVFVALVAPRARRRVALAIATGLCFAVELLQLTGLPAVLVDAWSPARYVLGTTFNAVDLLAYAVGAALACLADSLIRD